MTHHAPGKTSSTEGRKPPLSMLLTPVTEQMGPQSWLASEGGINGS
eukprot:CAMPEP_0174309934 /NCGR_PEP_ID=MMETSP0810-20121108/2733_1 /TAXON_ID=73025 ORGANISM="Eutreptiella gymnastica-like, Strain CCMP1594" /NCGR_SAMPLE_ID=MMETSP0810 /ASSEMBLY_ACC=CAM_ASM_000659 /LENGTH=45 /DNA_ID= /DNA_START= /DNA_END= /DNA_ORIENTATION=